MDTIKLINGKIVEIKIKDGYSRNSEVTVVTINEVGSDTEVLEVKFDKNELGYWQCFEYRVGAEKWSTKFGEAFNKDHNPDEWVMILIKKFPNRFAEAFERYACFRKQVNGKKCYNQISIRDLTLAVIPIKRLICFTSSILTSALNEKWQTEDIKKLAEHFKKEVGPKVGFDIIEASSYDVLKYQNDLCN